MMGRAKRGKTLTTTHHNTQWGKIVFHRRDLYKLQGKIGQVIGGKLGRIFGPLEEAKCNEEKRNANPK